MDEIFLLDEEEIFLLIGSICTLLFNSSFLFYFIKLFKSQINLIDIPILTIFLSYLNDLVWFTYSKYILHDIMRNVYLISSIISIIFILIYLIYEYKTDKTDSILNILLLISATLALNKFLTEALNDEDTIKLCCCYSIISILFGLLTSIIRAVIIKSNSNLNIYVGIFLVVMCGANLLYGLLYKELILIIINASGIYGGLSYLGFFYYLKINYTPLNFKESGGDSVIDIEVKNDKQEKNDSGKK
jgi:hypothetical protein